MSNPEIPKVFQKGWKPETQHQEGAPGKQKNVLDPQPVDDVTADGKQYKAAGKLDGRVALITGGDSGIGRAVAVLYALEGANVTISYKPEEDEDAKQTEQYIKQRTNGRAKVVLAPYDLRSEDECAKLIGHHLKAHNKKLDILVLNHGTQQAVKALPDLPSDQWRDVFDTNIHSFFYLTKRALPHMPTHKSPNTSPGAIVLNASVNPSVGHPELVDYTATKGAIIGFGRALSNQVVGETGIRVNMVAPGPIWTPLIPATMSKENKESFGLSTPIGRCGQPVEIATCFVFLASADASYVSGQVLHPNGGVIIA